MKHFWKNVVYLLQYALACAGYGIVRILPRCALRGLARFAQWVMIRFLHARRICEANVRVAFPDWDEKKIRQAADQSLYYVALNFLEFIWMSGNPKRIERICVLSEAVKETLRETQKGTRYIFVNPHLGSWEASGLVAPYYADVRMVAIAKPIRNPYLNRLINQHGREKAAGLKIVFSRGAMRSAVAALRRGESVGTLIDQNTRVRDGGEFVNFFGLSAPSSMAPAVLLRYCRTNNIPAEILYTTCVREGEHIVGYVKKLSRPLESYADDQAIIQELMHISEDFIRRYPEQYVWFYKRFCYIPADCPEELRKKYPWYGKTVQPTFYSKVRNVIGSNAER